MKLPWSWSGCWVLKWKFHLLWIAVPVMVWGQTATPQKSPIPQNIQLAQREVSQSQVRIHPLTRSSIRADVDEANEDLESCHVYKVKGLPGSHQYASHFIETMVSDPGPSPKDAGVVWGLTADLSDKIPSRDRALYILKSTNGGKTWIPVARLGSRYFDAKIGEGLRNGLIVSPDGTDFVVTTQEGAFQVFPQPDISAPVVKSIAGPRVPRVRPDVIIPKKTGDRVRAGVVLMTPDGKHMILGYGYFDLEPQLFTYHRDRRGSWIEDRPLPHLPNDLDIFSMQFGNPEKRHPASLYVGTGDQAYRLNLRTMKWTRVVGVGPDSAIHGMTTVGGLHLAACWGVYNPVSAIAVARVTHARFLLHRAKDQVGPNIRAYSINVDPARTNREVLTAITGVYTSRDSGQTWKRLNDLPDGEFHSAHFNSDGTIIISGFVGTFLANPFSSGCAPHLETRDP